jgi:hypothetical protein
MGSVQGPLTEKEKTSHESSMQRIFADITTIFPWGIRAGGEKTQGGAARQGVHLLGPVRGHAVLPGGADEIAAGSLHGVGQL